MTDADERTGIWATYRIRSTAEDIAARARELCIEQTVEVTEPLCQDPFIAQHVVAQVVGIEPDGDAHFRVTVAYEIDVLTPKIPQIINVLYGNISLKPGIRLVAIRPSPAYARVLGGPRFGIAGVRQRLGVHDRPLLISALKPMGRPVATFASDAYRLALGGMDIIKDDHGVNNQPFHPFEDRVAACADAVRRANEQSGHATLYFPTLMGPLDGMLDRARFAKDAGAGGFLVAPMLVGFDAMRTLAEATDLPVMAHPAMLGVFEAHPDHGIAADVVFGTLMRMIGADLVVFPSWGGRFPLTREVNARIDRACKADLEGLAGAFPVPAGGLTLSRVAEMRTVFGTDVGFLIGSSLYERSEDLTANAEHFRTLVS